MSEPTTNLPTFRVFFHDGKTLDFAAGHPLIAEKKARAAHPGGFVKKVKIIQKENAK